MKKENEVRDRRTDTPIFIHSELDDYGLTPIEFRIYARLSRRCGQQGAKESIPNMARGCKTSVRSTQLAMRLLELTCLIELEIRPGKTNLIYLLPRTKWAAHDALPALREQITSQWKSAPTPATTAPLQDQTPAMVAPDPCNGCTTTPAMVAYEGTPLEGTPLKGDSYSSPKVQNKNQARKRAGGVKTELPEWMPVAVWERWLLYRQEIKHPVAVSAIPAMLSRLDRFRQDGHSPVEVIEQTMANSWRGLFELPERNGNGNGKHQSDVKKPSNAERVRRNLARFGVEFPPHDSGSNTHGVS